MGALTSQPYRFRARPWDIEQAGSICTLCPSQCNVSFTVRDDRVLRVLARDHEEVDDGWLCDKGRFAYQAIHSDERITRPMIRDGGELREVGWDRALDEAAAALGRARGKVARARRRPDLQRGGPSRSRISCARCSAPRTSTRARPAGRRTTLRAALGHPELQATVPGHRVRPRGAGARRRARRRHADRRPADPQGRAAQPRQARRRDQPPVVAGPQRRGGARFAPGAGEAFLGGAERRAGRRRRGRRARRGRRHDRARRVQRRSPRSSTRATS